VQPVKVQSEMLDNALRAPSKIPKDIKMIKEDAAPPSFSGGGVMGGIGVGGPGGVVGGTGLATSAPVVTKAAPKGPIRISSGVVRANCIQCAQPQYPAIARSAHIQGHVMLEAVISKTGAIENLTVLSGPPLLRQAALDGVRYWRYKPTILNGEPTEVETQIDVNFTFGGG
jgi:protein TonB